VNYLGRNYCKSCIAMGMHNVPPAPPGGYYSRGPAVQAEPAGEPSREPFKIGIIGSILGIGGPPIVIMIVLSMIMPYLYYPYPDEQVLIDMAFIPVMAIVAVMGLAVLFQSIGLNGFYRNYGLKMGRYAAIFGYITTIVIIGLGASFPMLLMMPSAGSVVATFLVIILVAVILIFATGVFWGIAFIQVREFTDSEDLCMITGIAFLLGGILTVIPSILAAIVFYQAPLPTTGYTGERTYPPAPDK
jgi:hypothetical protein